MGTGSATPYSPALFPPPAPWARSQLSAQPARSAPHFRPNPSEGKASTRPTPSTTSGPSLLSPPLSSTRVRPCVVNSLVKHDSFWPQSPPTEVLGLGNLVQVPSTRVLPLRRWAVDNSVAADRRFVGHPDGASKWLPPRAARERLGVVVRTARRRTSPLPSGAIVRHAPVSAGLALPVRVRSRRGPHPVGVRRASVATGLTRGALGGRAWATRTGRSSRGGGVAPPALSPPAVLTSVSQDSARSEGR